MSFILNKVFVFDEEKNVLPAVIVSDKKRFSLVVLKDNSLYVCNNPAEIKNFFDLQTFNEYKNVLKYEKAGLNKAIVETAYNFFNSKPFKSFSNEEITQDFIKNNIDVKTLKQIQNSISSQIKLINDSCKISYNQPEDLSFDKTIQADAKSEIETALAIAYSNAKMALLLGGTGIGKTYSVRSFAKKNRLPFFETVIGAEGNYKKALFGERDIDSHNNALTIKYIPGALIRACRHIRDNKTPAVLFVDEAFRGNGMGIMTMFSPKEIDGKEYYELPGIANERFVLIKDKQNNHGWVIETSDAQYGVENGKINYALPKETSLSELEEAALSGKISRVSKETLEKYGYEIVEKGAHFKERFLIPVEKMIITLAGNIGTRFEMSQNVLDDAVISRSVVVKLSNLEKTPAELIKIAKCETSPLNIKFVKLNEAEKKYIEDFYTQFLQAVKLGVINDEIGLPNKAYENIRTISTIINLEERPDTMEIDEYLKELITKYLSLNYVDFNLGKENIQLNELQLDYIHSVINKIKQPIPSLENDNGFDFDKDVEENLHHGAKMAI